MTRPQGPGFWVDTFEGERLWFTVVLREALEDALARGEKLRRDITKEILNSQIFTDLANNPRFVNAVARVIRSREEVGTSVQKRVKEILGAMNILTRQQVKDFEKRVTRLEKNLDSVGRRMIQQRTKTTKSNSKARPQRKAAARKTVSS